MPQGTYFMIKIIEPIGFILLCPITQKDYIEGQMGPKEIL